MNDYTPRLYAPSTDQVALIVAERDDPIACDRQEDGWWQSREPIEIGTPYRFRLVSKSWFQDGEEVEVVDPESVRLSGDRDWTLADGWELADMDWYHDDAGLPDRERLVLYECHINDFNDLGDGGSFRSVIDRLDYLADLGITAIEFLPITDAGPDGGWGYTPLYYFAVAQRYGSRLELARLVDAVHERGMAVVFDGIYNHSGQDHPLTQIDHDLWYHHEPKDPEQSWGPEFDYDHFLPGTSDCPARQFVLRHLGYWIQVFHIDGIRFDAVAQIQHDPFLGEMRDRAHHWAADKPFACIAECAPIRPEIVGPDGIMDAAWRDAFCQTWRRVLIGEWDGEHVAGVIDCRNDGFASGIDVVHYLSNHDYGHLMCHLLDHDVDEGDALRRCGLAYTALLTTSARPMLFMGDEFGASCQAGEEGTPLPWHLLEEDERRQDLHHRIRRLLQARDEHAALRGDPCEILLRDDDQRVMGYHRWDDHGGRFVILLHAADGDADISLQMPEVGDWHEILLDHRRETASDGSLEWRLAAWEARVLRFVDGG